MANRAVKKQGQYEAMRQQMQLLMDDLISTDEAARRMGITRRQVWHMIVQEKLVGKQVGRAFVVYAPSIEGYTRSAKGRPPSKSRSQRRT